MRTAPCIPTWSFSRDTGGSSRRFCFRLNLMKGVPCAFLFIRKTKLLEGTVCDCLTFRNVLAGRDHSAAIDTNLSTQTLQFVTQCWVVNAVTTDEGRFGHRSQSSANVSVTVNITNCVNIAHCLAI
jgi:hypothetical protein